MEEIKNEVEDKGYVTIDEFKSLQIRIGTILSSEAVEGADKLLKLMVDMGEEQPRQILSGIREYFGNGEELVGKQVAFAANLQPRIIRGHESNGMIMATGGGEEPLALLIPSEHVAAGSLIR